MVKAIDCGIVESDFVLKSRYYVPFPANTLGKGMKPLIFPAKGEIVPLQIFKENNFGIKLLKNGWYPIKQRNQINQWKEYHVF